MTKTEHIVSELLYTFGGMANKHLNTYRLPLDHPLITAIFMHWDNGRLTIKAHNLETLVSKTVVCSLPDAVQFIDRYINN